MPNGHQKNNNIEQQPIDFHSILLHVGVIVVAVLLWYMHSTDMNIFICFDLIKKKKKCKQNDIPIVIVPFWLCALPKLNTREPIYFYSYRKMLYLYLAGSCISFILSFLCCCCCHFWSPFRCWCECIVVDSREKKKTSFVLVGKIIPVFLAYSSQYRIGMELWQCIVQ